MTPIPQLTGTSLVEANLMRAVLSDAQLVCANLHRANLTNATLTGANLAGADLTEANLSNTNLSKTNLSGTNLTGAKLTGTNFSGAIIDENTKCDNLPLLQKKISEPFSNFQSSVSIQNKLSDTNMFNHNNVINNVVKNKRIEQQDSNLKSAPKAKQMSNT